MPARRLVSSTVQRSWTFIPFRRNSPLGFECLASISERAGGLGVTYDQKPVRAQQCSVACKLLPIRAVNAGRSPSGAKFPVASMSIFRSKKIRFSWWAPANPHPPRDGRAEALLLLFRNLLPCLTGLREANGDCLFFTLDPSAASRLESSSLPLMHRFADFSRRGL